MVKKKEELICYKCKKAIEKEEKYVELITHNYPEKNKKDIVYFHFDCWIAFQKNKVQEKVNNLVSHGIEFSRSILQGGLKPTNPLDDLNSSRFNELFK